MSANTVEFVLGAQVAERSDNYSSVIINVVSSQRSFPQRIKLPENVNKEKKFLSYNHSQFSFFFRSIDVNLMYSSLKTLIKISW